MKKYFLLCHYRYLAQVKKILSQYRENDPIICFNVPEIYL